MSPEEKLLREQWKSKTDAELRQMTVKKYGFDLPPQLAATLLEERARRWKLWTSGVPGWVALLLAGLNFWLDWLARH
jgi:hypothetical protein